MTRKVILFFIDFVFLLCNVMWELSLDIIISTSHELTQIIEGKYKSVTNS
ncbi:hypothetical protein Lalb_Chr10g0103091 [Lupinus albus]|uniref:Uncharacterized protein n=1 Tax=Lupinus albus TaxID=3870 RepID=A0A6A4PXG3_LUPAL|nr:hypothetical protein Lalb_Chr10g0103091 [Lupinus albus]